jgi:hypothetical protein
MAAHECAELNIHDGVHSDTHAETGDDIATDGDSPIGCGYIKLRQTISQLIAEDPDKIVAEAERLRPELFTDPSDTDYAHDIVSVHESLAQDAGFFAGGSRKVAAAAASEGAPFMLVDGDHVAHVGILNLRPNSTIDSNAAHENSLSAYEHDAWVGPELIPQLSFTKHFAARQWEIAELLDTIGTMWALGAYDIAVRR